MTIGSEKEQNLTLAKVEFCFHELQPDENVTPIPYPVI
jgi:hypothetical protein